VRGHHLVQAAIHKGVAQHGERRLGAVPVVPPGHADPVAEFGALVLFGELQPHGADQQPLRGQGDGKGSAAPGLEVAGVGGDPFLRHAVQVGVRDVQRELGDGELAGQALHAGRVGRGERPQEQPLTVQIRRVLGHGHLPRVRPGPAGRVGTALRPIIARPRCPAP